MKHARSNSEISIWEDERLRNDLIVNGADPKSVQELLGHLTLDMTMRVYEGPVAVTSQ